MKQRKELRLFVCLRRVVLPPLLLVSLARDLDRLRLYGLRDSRLTLFNRRGGRDGLSALDVDRNGVKVLTSGAAELEIGAGTTLRFGRCKQTLF